MVLHQKANPWASAGRSGRPPPVGRDVPDRTNCSRPAVEKQRLGGRCLNQRSSVTARRNRSSQQDRRTRSPRLNRNWRTSRRLPATRRLPVNSEVAVHEVLQDGSQPASDQNRGDSQIAHRSDSSSRRRSRVAATMDHPTSHMSCTSEPLSSQPLRCLNVQAAEDAAVAAEFGSVGRWSRQLCSRLPRRR